jgi:hypothetical protein
LYQSKAIRGTLAAVDRADQAEALEGHERLAVLQNLLVDLLRYLESKEGFSVSLGELRRARLKGAYVGISPTESDIVKIVHQTRGRIRLRIPVLKADDTYAIRLRSLLESLEDVTSIRINSGAASAIITYSEDVPDAEFARSVVKTIDEGFHVVV